MDPNSRFGQQHVTLTWAAQDATGFTIAGSDGSSVDAPHTASSQLAYLPAKQGQPLGPVLYTITAHGYTAGGPEPSLQLQVEPVPVTNLRLTASPQQLKVGQVVTLTWSAIAATGFTLTGPGGISLDFDANVPGASLGVWIVGETTYTITAHGYTAGAPEPTATATITVTKQKDKDKDKEVTTHKEQKDGLEPILARSSARPGAGSDADLPSGTQQAFIGADERPDVGADLRHDR